MAILDGSIVTPMSDQVLTVSRENVLQARAVLLAEADDFLAFVSATEFAMDQWIGLCGGDPISRDAQRLFAARIRDNAFHPVQRYVRELADAAERLAEVARSYGFTEEQIARSFRPDRPDDAAARA